MKVLEFEKEEDNNAPIDIDDDGKYDKTDLFYEEDDVEDNDLCTGCNEIPIAYLVQPCGYMILTNCVKKNNRPLCGFRASNNKTIDLDDFE